MNEIAKWEELLRHANELRCAAYEVQSKGLHELADAKMRELEELVRQFDEDRRNWQ